MTLLHLTGGVAAVSAPVRISAVHDDLGHWYCDCDSDLSLCGRDLTDVPEDNFDEASCVVCEAMVAAPCPQCGAVD